jgi:hypothetical protein
MIKQLLGYSSIEFCYPTQNLVAKTGRVACNQTLVTKEFLKAILYSAVANLWLTHSHTKTHGAIVHPLLLPVEDLDACREIVLQRTVSGLQVRN